MKIINTAPGYERVPVDQKRMNPKKFITFEKEKEAFPNSNIPYVEEYQGIESIPLDLVYEKEEEKGN